MNVSSSVAGEGTRTTPGSDLRTTTAVEAAGVGGERAGGRGGVAVAPAPSLPSAARLRDATTRMASDESAGGKSKGGGASSAGGGEGEVAADSRPLDGDVRKRPGLRGTSYPWAFSGRARSAPPSRSFGLRRCLLPVNVRAQDCAEDVPRDHLR